MLLHFCR